MCVLWLVACLAGSVSTRLADLLHPMLFEKRYHGLGGFMVLFLFFLKNKKFQYLPVLLSLGGMYWGLSHTFPPGSAATGQMVTVVAQEAFSFQTRRVVTKTHSNKLYSAISKLAEGQQGRLNCKSDICFVMPYKRTFAANVTPLRRLQQNIRSSVLNRFKTLGSFEASWFTLLILGDSTGIDSQTLNAFKIAGLFHFLVISGFHICVLGDVLLLLSSCLVRPFYILRIIKPSAFIAVSHASSIGVGIVCLMFAMAVGMSAASQRASLAFFGVQCFRVLCPSMNFWMRVMLTACLQNLVFPFSFFSAGNVMSWFGYVTFVSGAKKGMKILLVKQSIMFCLTALLFEQWTPLGLLLNPILTEYFNVLVIGTVVAVFLGSTLSWLSGLAASLGMDFIACVELWTLKVPLHEWLQRMCPLGLFQSKLILFGMTGFLVYQLAYVDSKVKIKPQLQSGETHGAMEK